MLFIVYPKVKVREEKNQLFEDFAVDRDEKIDSLPLYVSSSPGMYCFLSLAFV